MHDNPEDINRVTSTTPQDSAQPRLTIAVPYHEQVPNSFLRKLHHAEAWLGAFTGTLLSFLFVSVLLLPNNLAVQLPALAYLGLVIGLGCLFEGPFLLRIWSATFKRERPIGPAVAKRTRASNIVLRIFSICWWTAHVVIAMLCIVGVEVQVVRKAGNAQVAASIIIGLLVFGMSICCNVFIALLVKALFGKDSAVEIFWKWRLIVDTCLTAIALFVAAGL